MDSKKVLLEELSKINKLIAFKPGQLISELGLPGLQGYTPNILVDCTKVPGYSYGMAIPTAQEQQTFATQSGLNPYTPANQIFFCDRTKMNLKLIDIAAQTASNVQNVVGNQTNNVTNTAPPAAGTPQIPSELKDTNGVKTFQDWLDQNKPGWATGFPEGKLNRNRGYGRFGPRTSKAWSSYKTEYTSGTVQNPNVIPGSEIGSGEPYYNPEAPAQSAPVPAAGTPAAGTPAVVPDANAVQLPNDQQIPSNPDDIKINGL